MPGSKVLVLGGTGPAGICLLRELVHRQHQTVAYARNPSKVPEDLKSNQFLEIVKGEMDDLEALSTAVSKCSVVLSLLGPSITSRGVPKSLFADFYKTALFPLMRQHGVRRIFAMGTISIESPEDKFSLFQYVCVRLVWLFANFAYRNVINIGEVFENEAQGLEWTVYRIASIPGGSDEESWKKGREDGELFTGWVAEKGWTSSTNRSLLARWLVDGAEGNADNWVGKMPAVSRRAA
ncbi:Fc.00g107120.m01.CDS01 [Cosmosporella sp. VM-42]